MIPRLDQLSRLPDAFPVLHAGEFVLREITSTDAPDWHRYLSDVETIYWTSTPLMSLLEVEDMIAFYIERFRDKTAIRWALSDGLGGAMLGDCGYNHFWERDGRGEIGYQLDKERWGKGMMTQAVASIIEYGFQELDLNKVEATVSVGNERSSGLLRKLGFQLEGTIRDYRNRRGALGDSWYFGLLRREWNGGVPR
jgi:ribosomal-protein-alanine N-acetyltransferase